MRKRSGKQKKNPKYRRLATLGIALLITTIAILFTYRKPPSPAGIEIDKTLYPVTGIDVSNHTGQIDFGKIKEQGIDFVYIKATEGTDFTDEKFQTNFQNATINAIPVGAYHFFKFNSDGRKQAANFLQNIKDKKLDLPLVLDVEEWDNTLKKKPKEIVEEIRDFIDEVGKTRKDRVIIYTNESGYQKYIEGNFDKYAIWICSFNDQPNIVAEWTFWQHSHKGRLEGAEGWVDVNTFNGDRAEWTRYLYN